MDTEEPKKNFTFEGLAHQGQNLILNGRSTNIIFADYAWNKIVKEMETASIILDPKILEAGRVVVTGETGTGKELVCRELHNSLSANKERPYVAINCGALPENLVESHLFGHRKGAFTSAIQDNKGAFEEAIGGTLLLDEIGDLSLSLQVKLLRALEERKICPVGSFNTTDVSSVSVICATNKDFKKAIEEEKFRKDLWYRIEQARVNIPPLRERRDDIPVLIGYFAQKIREALQEKCSSRVNGLTAKAITFLKAYDWPGNVRELINVVNKAVISCRDKKTIDVKDLPQEIINISSKTIGNQPLEEGTSLRAKVQQVQKKYIEKALAEAKGNKTQAAIILDITRRTLFRHIKELGIPSKFEKL